MVIHHPVTLRGLGFDPVTGAPMAASRPIVLEAEGDDFIASLLDDLATAEGRVRLARRTLEGETLRLYQPVHRTFQLALFEAVCAIPGEPRLAPDHVESAGVVVRRCRVREGGKPRSELAAWVRRRGRVVGWVALDDADRDPAPERRARPITGVEEVDRRVRARLGDDASEEAVTALFAVPPAIAEAVGRSIYYAVIPTASAEAADHGTAAALALDEVLERLPEPLQRGGRIDVAALSTLRASDALEGTAPGKAAPLKQLLTLLRRLQAEYRAFDGAARGESSEALRVLNRVTCRVRGVDRPLGDELFRATGPLLDGDPKGAWVAPDAWPEISDEVRRDFARAVLPASSRQAAAVIPRIGRFDTPGSRYHLRGFVRVRGEGACPPTIRWSAPTREFEIVPWHAAGKAPPVPVVLPAVTRDNIAGFKPNVSFIVPGNIQGVLANNSPEDFLKGKATPSDLALDWICGFNIPLITLCAFIVLNIFLTLFNLIFWWLPFIKICIPIPRALKDRLPDGSVT